MIYIFIYACWNTIVNYISVQENKVVKNKITQQNNNNYMTIPHFLIIGRIPFDTSQVQNKEQK